LRNVVVSSTPNGVLSHHQESGNAAPPDYKILLLLMPNDEAMRHFANGALNRVSESPFNFIK
jgi:hypothetical protein